MSYRNFVKWTEEEIAGLFDGIRVKKSVEEIASDIKKSESAIRVKIREHLFKRHKEQQEPVEVLAESYNMTVEEVQDSLAFSDNTTNRGKKWDDEEVTQLLREVFEKKTFEEIALIHKRTVLGIKCRLMEIAADYYYLENRPIKNIVKFTGLSEEEVVEAIDKRGKKEKNAKEKVEKLESVLYKDQDSSFSQDFLERLERIEKKIDLILSKNIF